MKLYNLETEKTIEYLKGMTWVITDKNGGTDTREFELDSESGDYVSLFTRLRACKDGSLELFQHGSWGNYIRIDSPY